MDRGWEMNRVKRSESINRRVVDFVKRLKKQL